MMLRCSLLIILGVFAQSAVAHSFGVVYTLPLPFWLYGWGAGAALVTSFAVMAFFMNHQPEQTHRQNLEISQHKVIVFIRTLRLRAICQCLSVALLVLCIIAGLQGTQQVYQNFNMTFFWIIFVLGFAYLTALVGNIYASLNPWKCLATIIGQFSQRYAAGLFRYPKRLAYWPALIAYMGFIWVELFGSATPANLSWLLLGYTVLNIMGAGLVGARDWFRYCEFFGVFFSLLALMAPVDYRPGTAKQDGQLKIRLPFSGIYKAGVAELSLLLFILFMLSSTAFDGLHETRFWRAIFWRDLYLSHLQYYTSDNPLLAGPQMHQLWQYWQQFWLLLSPLVYLLVYVVFIGLSKLASQTSLSLRTLCMSFAPTLLPIALVYHIAHYYTLLQTQGVKVIALLSDPFGRGDNWLGTANWFKAPAVPDLDTVWHTQVALIVLGHIVSVYLAHRVALECFEGRRQALVSQLPMLALMVAFTTAGLWILSKPIGS